MFACFIRIPLTKKFSSVNALEIVYKKKLSKFCEYFYQKPCWRSWYKTSLFLSNFLHFCLIRNPLNFFSKFRLFFWSQVANRRAYRINLVCAYVCVRVCVGNGHMSKFARWISPKFGMKLGSPEGLNVTWPLFKFFASFSRKPLRGCKKNWGV